MIYCKPNLNHFCYLHFCPKNSTKFEISTLQVIPIWKCMRFIFLALSQLVRVRFEFRDILFKLLTHSLCQQYLASVVVCFCSEAFDFFHPYNNILLSFPEVGHNPTQVKVVTLSHLKQR